MVDMLNIYNFIIEMQELIGNSAEVVLLALDGRIIIHVHWWEDNLHLKRALTKDQLNRLDNGLVLDFFVLHCRNEYAIMKNKLESIPQIHTSDGPVEVE